MSRLAHLLVIALAAQAAGAERVCALVPDSVSGAVVQAAAGPVAGAGQATLEALDGGAPLPFVRVDESTTTAELQTLARPVREPRESHRTENESLGPSGNAREMTRARAQALAYLEYSLALLQRRAGIPTNHTTAPPPISS